MHWFLVVSLGRFFTCRRKLKSLMLIWWGTVASHLNLAVFLKTLQHKTLKLISTQLNSRSVSNGNTKNKERHASSDRRLWVPAEARPDDTRLRYSTPCGTQREDGHEQTHKHATTECLEGVQTAARPTGNLCRLHTTNSSKTTTVTAVTPVASICRRVWVSPTVPPLPPSRL